MLSIGVTLYRCVCCDFLIPLSFLIISNKTVFLMCLLNQHFAVNCGSLSLDCIHFMLQTYHIKNLNTDALCFQGPLFTSLFFFSFVVNLWKSFSSSYKICCISWHEIQYIFLLGFTRDQILTLTHLIIIYMHPINCIPLKTFSLMNKHAKYSNKPCKFLNLYTINCITINSTLLHRSLAVTHNKYWRL